MALRLAPNPVPQVLTKVKTVNVVGNMLNLFFSLSPFLQYHSALSVCIYRRWLVVGLSVAMGSTSFTFADYSGLGRFKGANGLFH